MLVAIIFDSNLFHSLLKFSISLRINHWAYDNSFVFFRFVFPANSFDCSIVRCQCKIRRYFNNIELVIEKCTSNVLLWAIIIAQGVVQALYYKLHVHCSHQTIRSYLKIGELFSKTVMVFMKNIDFSIQFDILSSKIHTARKEKKSEGFCIHGLPVEHIPHWDNYSYRLMNVKLTIKDTKCENAWSRRDYLLS